jgi:hypothetical protein
MRQQKLAGQENSLLQNMADAIEDYFDRVTAAGGRFLVNCETPGHSWGWKIDSDGVRIVECGCYVEAVWPIVATSVLGGLGKVIGTTAGKKITRKLYTKYAESFCWWYSSNIALDFKNNLDLFRRGLQFGLRLPDVPPGYIRVWRGEGRKAAHELLKCSDSMTTTGRWFTPYRGTARKGYTGLFDSFMMGPSTPLERNWMYYLDIPESEYKKMVLSNQIDGYWKFLPDDVTNLSEDIVVKLGAKYDAAGNFIGTLKRKDGKIVLEGSNGNIYDAVNQGWHETITTDLLGTDGKISYRVNRPTVLKVRNADGSISKVVDIPGPEHIDLNPQLFPWSERSASEEVFLTDEWIGKAKASVIDNVDEIEASLTCAADKVYEKMEQIVISDRGPRATLIADGTTITDVGGMIQKISPGPLAEQFIDPNNVKLRQQFNDELIKVLEEYETVVSKFFDISYIESSPGGYPALPDLDGGLREISRLKEAISIPNGSIGAQILSRFSNIIAFAINILNYATIVVDKECSTIITDDTVRSYSNGPSDKNAFGPKYRYTIENTVDAIYFGGKWKGASIQGNIAGGFVLGAGFRKQDKVCAEIAEALGDEPSWDKIYQTLIDHRLPVWPNMTENCECTECPSGYQLCSYGNLVNLYTDVYNICLPVCGGQETKSILTSGVAVRANCELGCPDGYQWVECSKSDCPESVPCSDSSYNDNKSSGFCVKIPEANKFREFDSPMFSSDTVSVPPKYGRLFWDPTVCRWICKNFVDVQEIVRPDGSIEIVTPDNWEPRFSTGSASIDLLNPFTPNRVIFYSECPEGFIRIPENNCSCEELNSSGSYDDIGIPEVPEGYILFDGNVIRLIDEDNPSYGDSGDPECSSIDSLKEENPNSSLGQIIGNFITMSSFMLICFQQSDEQKDNCKDLTPSQQEKLDTLIRISDESYYTKTFGSMGYGLQPVPIDKAKNLELHKKRVKQFLCLVLQMETEKDYDDVLEMTARAKQEIMSSGLFDSGYYTEDSQKSAPETIKSRIRQSELYQWQVFIENMVLASRNLVNLE